MDSELEAVLPGGHAVAVLDHFLLQSAAFAGHRHIGDNTYISSASALANTDIIKWNPWEDSTTSVTKISI